MKQQAPEGFYLAERWADGDTYSCRLCARYSTDGHGRDCPFTALAAMREALLQWNYYWTDPRGLEDARAIKAKKMTDAALKLLDRT